MHWAHRLWERGQVGYMWMMTAQGEVVLGAFQEEVRGLELSSKGRVGIG